MKTEWHNPDPMTLGEVLAERKTANGKNKIVIIRIPSGNLMVHGYTLDDSDLLAGYSQSVGWVSESGPSIVDTMAQAESLAQEYLTRGMD